MGSVSVVGTLPALYFIEAWGRRKVCFSTNLPQYSILHVSSHFSSAHSDKQFVRSSCVHLLLACLLYYSQELTGCTRWSFLSCSLRNTGVSVDGAQQGSWGCRCYLCDPSGLYLWNDMGPNALGLPRRVLSAPRLA